MSTQQQQQHQQHVINMTGLDSGPVTTGMTTSSGSHGTQHAALYHNSMPMGSPVDVPPGAYRMTPSHHSPRSNQSAYQPLSPSQAMSPSQSGQYTSPRLSTLSPNHNESAANAQLGRSQSLGHAAYQQMQVASQQQQQQQQQRYGSSSLYSQQQPMETSMYRSRDLNASSHSEGNPAGSLLPTINTQVTKGASMGSPYSPNLRQSMMVDTPTYSGNVGPPPRISPAHPQSSSPYGSPATNSNRPLSMYDLSYGTQNPASTSRHTYNPNDILSASVRASPGGTRLQKINQYPSENSSGGSYQQPDLLPMYSTAAINSTSQLPTSPYQQFSSNQSIGAPPRRSVAGYDGAEASGSQATAHRQRRDTVTRSGVGEEEDGKWKNRPRQSHEADRDGTEASAAYTRQGPPPRVDARFRRVRDLSDLQAVNEPAMMGTGRRADPSGGYVSPLKAMTAYLHHTYHLVNPAFFYELSFNPRRVLTKPSKPCHNDGHDNEDSDYILYVNDWLGADEGNKYLILDVLGQGTFGQVVKCQNMKTREIVAVKVIKNKPAYFNQSMMEVTILEMLNGNWDPHDQHHILRLRDTFIHAKHLCLVFELLSSNLYELIKQNSFRGLSTSLVRVFTTQLLDALTVLHEARLIHCDLKPENILLKTLQTPSIKLVDFGSACHERQTVYTYIQSRFYRSPEVLLGLPYNASIDMWSLGCIAVELFLGLPLFPGTSEYNQICRIVEMLGLPPAHMLESGKQTGEFFNVHTDEYNRRTYKIKGLEQYSKEHNVDEQPSKRYFQATTLPDIIKTYPLARKSGKPADVQKEMANRTSFVDFVSGLLNIDPLKRWTPQQAKLHPFITGEKLVQPFRPPLSPVDPLARSKSIAGPHTTVQTTDTNKHPYGGLPQTPTKATGRAYHDAAAYNQHLAQQQAYHSAHQQRSNQVNAVANNPYAQEEAVARNEQAQAAEANAHAQAAARTQVQVQQAQAHAHAQAQAQAHAHAHAQAQAQAQAAQMQMNISPTYGAPSSNAASAVAMPYTAQSRARSNTMTRMDLVPGQLAKMGIEAGQSMTPVLSRDDAMREWDRRQQQQRNDYQHMDPMVPKVEYSATSPSHWSPPNSVGNLNQLSAAAMSLSGGMLHSAPSMNAMVDAQQRQYTQQPQMSVSAYDVQRGIASPSRHLVGTAGTGSASMSAGRYSNPHPSSSSSNNGSATTMNNGGHVSLAGFDPYTSDIAQLMPALQPTQYHGSSRRQSQASSSSSLYSTPGAASPNSESYHHHQQQQQQYHNQQQQTPQQQSTYHTQSYPQSGGGGSGGQQQQMRYN